MKVKESAQPAKNELVFKIITDESCAIKAIDSTDGKKRVGLTASTSALDLVQDSFDAAALKQMEDAAPGTTMFLNHSYNVPDDVFGLVETANLELKSAAIGGAEQKIFALEYVAVVDEGNPAALRTFKQIQDGIKLGASVSVLITSKKDMPDRRVITGIKYLECSIVGIPCNPQSWAHTAKAALLNAPDGSAVPATIAKGQDAIDALAKVQPAKEAVIKGAQSAPDCGFAGRDTKWDKSAAEGRWREHTKATDEPNDAYAKGFLWVDSDNKDKYGSYKLLIVDVVDDKEVVVPKAVFAVAGVLQGARGGTDIPDDDQKTLKGTVESIYEKMAKEFDDDSLKAPWVDEKKSLSSEQVKKLAHSAWTAAVCKFSRKGVYEDALAAAENSFWHLVDILCDCMMTLRWNSMSPGAEQIDYEAVAAELLSEFTATVMSRYVPMLTEEASENGDDYADDVLYYFFEDRPENLRANKTALAVIAEPLKYEPLTVLKDALTKLKKEGKRNSDADLKMVQTIHDTAKSLGADCGAGDVKKDDDADGDMDSESYSFLSAETKTSIVGIVSKKEASLALVKAVEQHVATLTQTNKDLEKERDEWKEQALLSGLTLVQLGNERLPRPGLVPPPQ